ncbi:hypothetical protein HDU82_002988 [Entophlyctis luteolus]|nr:hypothetical protein HDU82_002988 [Entophlyctis luteolus]
MDTDALLRASQDSELTFDAAAAPKATVECVPLRRRSPCCGRLRCFGYLFMWFIWSIVAIVILVVVFPQRGNNLQLAPFTQSRMMRIPTTFVKSAKIAGFSAKSKPGVVQSDYSDIVVSVFDEMPTRNETEHMKFRYDFSMVSFQHDSDKLHSFIFHFVEGAHVMVHFELPTYMSPIAEQFSLQDFVVPNLSPLTQIVDPYPSDLKKLHPVNIPKLYEPKSSIMFTAATTGFHLITFTSSGNPLSRQATRGSIQIEAVSRTFPKRSSTQFSLKQCALQPCELITNSRKGDKFVLMTPQSVPAGVVPHFFNLSTIFDPNFQSNVKPPLDSIFNGISVSPVIVNFKMYYSTYWIISIAITAIYWILLLSIVGTCCCNFSIVDLCLAGKRRCSKFRRTDPVGIEYVAVPTEVV